MKSSSRWLVVLTSLAAVVAIPLTGCTTGSRSQSPAQTHIDQPTVVPVACGECLFGMKGKGCDLAVKIGGKGYYVDGVKMDDLGDAHAADGMCNAVRQARVTGEIRNGRFVASRFELLPEKH